MLDIILIMPPFGGGLLQLIAYGGQDLYLMDGDCFRKREGTKVYARKYTNFNVFTMQWVREETLSVSTFTEKRYNELRDEYKLNNVLYLESNLESRIENTDTELLRLLDLQYDLTMKKK